MQQQQQKQHHHQPPIKKPTKTSLATFNNIPFLLWHTILTPYFNFAELCKARLITKLFEVSYQRFLLTKQLRVPQDIHTISEAIRISTILNARTHLYNKTTPLVLKVKSGVYSNNPIVLNINFSITILGENKYNTIYIGSIKSTIGSTNDAFVMKHLTIRGASQHGTYYKPGPVSQPGPGLKICSRTTRGGNTFELENILVTRCRIGLCLQNVSGKCKSIEIRENEGSGVVMRGRSTITISGNSSSIHHNGTNSRGAFSYGIVNVTHCTSNRIYLVLPLTKENTFTDHNEGRNISQRCSKIFKILDEDGKEMNDDDSSDEEEFDFLNYPSFN